MAYGKLIFYFFIFIFWFSSCIVLKPVEFKGIENVKVEKITNRSVLLNTGIKIRNNNSFSFYLKNVDLYLTVNDRAIADIRRKEKILIPAGSENIYDIPLEVDFSGILKSGGSLLKFAAGKDLSIHFKGQLRVGKFIFSKKLMVDVEKKISLKDLM
jgi:LEA14-like dessication related protein